MKRDDFNADWTPNRTRRAAATYPADDSRRSAVASRPRHGSRRFQSCTCGPPRASGIRMKDLLFRAARFSAIQFNSRRSSFPVLKTPSRFTLRN